LTGLPVPLSCTMLIQLLSYRELIQILIFFFLSFSRSKMYRSNRSWFYHFRSFFVDLFSENIEKFVNFWQILSTFFYDFLLITGKVLSVFDKFMSIFDNIYQFLTRFINFWQDVSIFDKIYQFLTRFIDFWQHLSISDIF